MNEDVRENWRGTRFRPTENLEEVMDGKRRTAVQRLAVRYRLFAIVGLAAIPCLSPIFFQSDIIPDRTHRIIITLMFALFFIIAATIDLCFYSRLNKVDCTTKTVSEAREKARRYRRRHLQAVMILFPTALAVVVTFAIFVADPDILKGMMLGGVIGLLIGSRQLYNFLRDYRTLID